MSWIALAGAALASASLAAQDGSATAARWEIDYGDRQCRLSRTTGGADPTLFSLQLSPVNHLILMTLVNPAWSQGTRLPNRVEIVLRPDGARSGHAARDARVPATGHRFMQVDELDLLFLDRLAQAAAISLEANGQVLISLPLPNADEAVQALRACNDDLLSGWGVDVVLWNSLRIRPEPIGGFLTIFSASDYPAAAFSAGVSGALVIRYAVDVDGRVSACTVVESSGHASLDEGTCRLMLARGRFRPAIGADGEPVATQLVMPVRWEMQ